MSNERRHIPIGSVIKVEVCILLNDVIANSKVGKAVSGAWKTVKGWFGGGAKHA